MQVNFARNSKGKAFIYSLLHVIEAINLGHQSKIEILSSITKLKLNKVKVKNIKVFMFRLKCPGKIWFKKVLKSLKS